MLAHLLASRTIYLTELHRHLITAFLSLHTYIPVSTCSRPFISYAFYYYMFVIHFSLTYDTMTIKHTSVHPSHTRPNTKYWNNNNETSMKLFAITYREIIACHAGYKYSLRAAATVVEELYRTERTLERFNMCVLKTISIYLKLMRLTPSNLNGLLRCCMLCSLQTQCPYNSLLRYCCSLKQ